MKTNILKEIDQLKRMTVTDLRRQYRDVFGEETRSHHKAFLYRRIAWRLQADAEGDLSERARRRAMELRRRQPRTAAPRRSHVAGAGGKSNRRSGP